MAYGYSIGADEALAGSHSLAFSNAFDVNTELYWVGGASGDTTNWHNALNWVQSSGAVGRVPVAGDIAYFNVLGIGYDCVIDAAVECSAIITEATWSKNFTMGSSASITVSEDILFDHTGTLTLQNTLTLSGDGVFHIGSGVGTLTLTACDIDLKGITRIDVDKTLSAAVAFRNVTCAYSGKTTDIVGSVQFYYSGVLTLASGGSFVFNISVGSTPRIYWVGSGVITPIQQNGATITTPLTNDAAITLQPQAAATITLSFSTASAYLGINLNDCTGQTVTYNLSSTFTAAFLQIINTSASSGTIIVNTNDNDITLNGSGVYASFAVNYNIGSPTASVTCNFGSANINVLGVSGVTTVRAVGAAVVFNLETSVWTVSGNALSLSGVSILNSGTSTINVVNTSTITATGKTFATLVLGTLNVAKIITFAGGANTFGRLLLNAKTTVAFLSATTYTITSYVSGDWNGTSGNLVTLKSTTNGQQHTLVNPAGMSVSYVDVRDSVATNNILAYISNGNVNTGNNLKWVFGGWFLLALRNELYRSKDI